MTGLVLALVAGYGSYLLYTAMALGWKGLGLGPPSATGTARPRPSLSTRLGDWLRQAGLEDVRAGEFAGAIAVLFTLGAVAAWTLFGGVLPALVAACFAATFPVAAFRARRERTLAATREAWPRMIEELRVLTGPLGRSIPQALFEVGRRGPASTRGAFAAAEREWLMTIDFARTVTVLKVGLSDPTADATCETLLVAHEIGGSQLDRRLAALAEDRIQDVQGRKDARARQAGVRFARRFVLIVPLGMAVAGLSIGSGRAAYQTPLGQVAVVVGLVSIILCWAWAGRLLRLPDERRVFGAATNPPGGRPMPAGSLQ